MISLKLAPDTSFNAFHHSQLPPRFTLQRPNTARVQICFSRREVGVTPELLKRAKREGREMRRREADTNRP